MMEETVKKTMTRMLVTLGAVAGLLSVATGRAQAQTSFGAEALFGSDTDFGIGGRLQIGLGTTAPLDFQGSFDLFFPDGPADYWEVNGNIWYSIPTTGTVTVPYVGGGLNIGVVDRGSGFDSETEVGLNLGGGARFEFENTTPFVEARFVIGGVEQFVIGGGFMFGRF